MASSLVRGLLFPVLLAAGLLAPGWLLGRALRTPAGPMGAFLGSAVLLLNLLLLLDALGVPLTGTDVAGGLALLCALLAVIGKVRTAPPDRGSPQAGRGFHWHTHQWLLVPALIGLGAVVIQASLEPLSGFDTAFRWDFLARQMLRAGSLHFYPPVTADDFVHYSWPDGIAPLVSNLYFWAYLSWGRAAAGATVPVVIGQAALLFWCVHILASRRGGVAAGGAAVAILATSSVFLWGVAMGQETGLTALAVIGMFLFIEKHQEEPGRSWLVWAGLAAGAGALAREYGAAFAVLGGVALAWQRTPRRGWLEFALTATAIALPWYARNWIKTGNPLYSHELGGLFPVNAVYVEYMQIVRGLGGFGANHQAWPAVIALLASLAGVPLALGVAGGLTQWRERGPWLAALLGLTAVWLWTAGQTSGGYGYSLRVLTPALALGAVLGAPRVARWTAARHGWILIVLCSVLAVDAGVRSLYLPTEPYAPWWRLRPAAWRDFRRVVDTANHLPVWAALADAAAGRLIVVSDPVFHANLTERGARPVPFFSPAVRFLFAPDADYSACLERLRAGGVRFVMLGRHNDFTDRQLAPHPFFQQLQAARPVAAAPLYFVYDLYAPGLGGTVPIRPPAAPAHAP